ncbi:hypothetical protein [Liquorilactobacillus hordei]|uniref:hypothetical protein n=1 Tax=Liquorilactobacillus hordei TaxID=468911 RepID=UPI0039ED00D8
MKDTHYWRDVLSGIWKIILTSFIPILFWSYFFKWSISIENWLHLPQQLRPLFLSTVLVSIPGALLFPGLQWIFRRCEILLKSDIKNDIILSLDTMEPKNLVITVGFTKLSWVSWKMIRLFNLSFFIVPTSNIVLIKCADNKTSTGYYHMNKSGYLEIDITHNVDDIFSTTCIDVPAVIQPFGTGGKATIKIKSRGRLLYRMLVRMVIDPKVNIKLR